MGKILDMARRDAANFITKGGFESELTFTRESESFVINGIAIKRTDSLEYDDGSYKTEKFSRITIPILSLPSAFKKGDLIAVAGWSVTFKDSEGISSTYQLKDSFPNKTIGIISIDLSNAEENTARSL